MRNFACFFVSTLVVFNSYAQAAVYYVDYTNGNDSNNGTSLATAFKTMTPVTGTNFLNPGDHVEVLPNNSFVGSDSFFKINSSGILSNPIVIERYQAVSGTDPIFYEADPTSSIVGWTGWNNVSGNIWKSNVVVPWTVNGVIIDGSYNLLEAASINCGDLSHVSYRWCQASGFIEVILPDLSDPNGHTVEFTAQHQTNYNNGTITTNGDYINFKHIGTYGSTTFGWLIANRGIHVDNSYSYFSGRESLYCATYFQTVGCYNGVFNNFIGEYSNGGSGGAGDGQNVTIEGSYNDFINGTIAYGGMAGFDCLNYTASTNIPTQTTPASFNRLINTTVFQNSRRSLQNYDAGGFDSQVYNDGGNNNQFINLIIKGNESNQFSYPVSGQNATFGIYLSSEHPSIAIPHDFIVDNIQTSAMTDDGLAVESVGSDGNIETYNINIMNSTFTGDTNDGGGVVAFANFNAAYGNTLHLHNNIFYQNSGATKFVLFFTSVGHPPDSNNNLYWSTAGAAAQIIQYAGTGYTLSGWQSFSSQDSNSLVSNPFLVNLATGDFHLQRTSLGQANNSPAIGAGLAGYANQFFNIYNLGTTRTDGIIDSSINPDIGYHYNLSFGSSNSWNKGFSEQYN